MLHYSHVPLQFWAEAVAHAMYLRNRSYSSSTPSTTPFERLWKSKPDLSQLRIFRCEAYALIDESARSKFASRTIRTMYVGNEPDVKGYCLYCQKFFVSRNVQFNEANSYNADSPSPLLLPAQDIFADEDSRRDESPPPPRRSSRIRRPPTRFMDTTPVFQPAASSPPQSSTVPTSEQHEDVIDDSVSNTQEDVNPMVEDISTSIPVALDDSEDMDVSTIYDAPFLRRRPREETIDEDFETEDDIIVSKRQRILVAFAVHSTGLPTTIQQAHSSSEREEWIKATNAEYDSLMEHETWTLCELPPGRKPIGCRWLFTKKYSADGSLLRYKARLVAQGFTQVAGIDYTDIFAPVIRTSSIRFLLSLAALQSMHICHMDVQTAFLNGNLQETLYMRQPPGYVQPGQDHLVCRLNKSIYGLKQSSREWNSALDSYFKSKGFVQLKTDPCIYFQRTR
ncbi:hypothetical protein LEN26_019152 [Aphanomyces euteiches]|nr:hypothetical protein LEN26_019152 [Aphanomyces euteiches]